MEPRADQSAIGVFLAWEKLRIAYNIVLVLVVVVTGFGELGSLRFWRELIIPAVCANAFYCAGPCAENYRALVNQPRSIVRPVLFVSGTLLAAVLAFMTVFFRGWGGW